MILGRFDRTKRKKVRGIGENCSREGPNIFHRGMKGQSTKGGEKKERNCAAKKGGEVTVLSRERKGERKEKLKGCDSQE